MWVALRVAVHDAEGAPVQDEPQETSFVVGYGAVLPALEDGLSGLAPGTKKSITLKPKDAFGERDPKAVLEVLRDEFPEDVAEGDVFEAEEDPGPDAPGGTVLLRVLEVRPDVIVLDRNHPLAGQQVRFDVQVVEVRPADDAEIAAAEQALSTDETPEEALIPAASLLRGPTRRYTKDP
jgi:FKBP-type peptidyl-prolyl cis-trans isomerase SlyD